MLPVRHAMTHSRHPCRLAGLGVRGRAHGGQPDPWGERRGRYNRGMREDRVPDAPRSIVVVMLLAAAPACTDFAHPLDRAPPRPSSNEAERVSAQASGAPPILGAANSGRVPGSDPAPAEPAPLTSSDAGVERRDAGAADVADAAAELPAPPDAAPPSCPDGVLFAGSCYRQSTTMLAWADALADCVAWGGALVRIDSAEEDAFVASLTPGSIWIGASDQAADNAFTWSDGSPITFANWGPNQPDAFPGQDCIEKREEPGEPWYDQPCSAQQLFTCERDGGQ